MRTLRTTLAFILFTAIFFSACQREPNLEILSIYSVKAPLREIIKAYNKENPKTKFKVFFKPTGTAYNEINGEQSSANLAIMLNSEWLDSLINSNKLHTVKVFARNSLLLVGSVYAKDSITTHSDILTMLTNDQLGVNDPASNVSGKLTLDLLKYYNIYDGIKNKIRFFPTTRSTLQAVEVSQVNYAIIYQTDALTSDSVKTIYAFPQESYAPIVFSIGVVSYNYHKESENFIDFVQTKDAQEIFESYGFQ